MTDYTLGKLRLKWNKENGWWDAFNTKGVFIARFYIEKGIKDAGGVAVEECMRAGWCEKCEEVHPNPLKPQPEECPPNTPKPLHVEDECQQTTQNRVDKIEMPKTVIGIIMGNSDKIASCHDMHKWMRLVTDTLTHQVKEIARLKGERV
jgi:hypothetical protein